MNKNPYYPLPEDYDELTMDGQKQARLAVLTKQDTPDHLVQAWMFFRQNYLIPAGDAFYKGGYKESPPFHYQCIRDLGTYPRNALGAPRGSAKSVIVGTEVPLFFSLTRPNFETMLGLATDRLVEERFDKIAIQITENPFILNDFGLLRPKRGRAIWNRHHLHLKNGAVLKGISVMGKKRGGRPQLFILDDPENDPDSDSQQSAEVILQKFEKILFRQVIPMLEHGSSIFWIGTLINRRSFLYHATKGDDERFKFWNRRVLQAIAYDSEGKAQELWPTQWPADVLESRKQEIGAAAFAAEYLNEPISETERIFTIDPRRNEYIVSGSKEYLEKPFETLAEVSWCEPDEEKSVECNKTVVAEQKKPLKELVAPMFRIGVFDYASGFQVYSDYSCYSILGFDTNNTLWILDMWMGRAKEAQLLKIIYEMSLRWQVRVIGVEAASIQIAFADAVSEFMTKQGEPNGWRPRVLPIKYPPNVSKSDRIGGLEWRFHPGRIKYPAHLRSEWPINQLYMQTEDFTQDLALLPHDDAIDTIAMSQYVIHSKGVRMQQRAPELNLERRIRTGKPEVPGIPMLSGTDTSKMTREEFSAILDKAYEMRYNNSRERNRMYGRY